MGNRKSAAELISEKQAQEIITYFSTHTFTNTAAKFNLSRSALTILLKKYGIKQHDSATAEVFKHLQLDRYDNMSDEDKLTILEYYKTSSITLTCQHFNIKEYFLKYLINSYGCEKHSKADEQKFTNQIWYSPDWGTHKGKQKSTNTKEEIVAKAKQTKLERYGDSNFNNREQCKKTVQKIYGCDNVFQSTEIKEKATKTKLTKYGDAAFTNRKQAQQTCLKKYGATTYLGSNKNTNLYHNKNTCNNEYLKCFYNKDYLAKVLTELSEQTCAALGTRLNIVYSQARHLVEKFNLTDILVTYRGMSHYEQEIADYIGVDLCERNNRTILNGKEIDIYIPSKKIGIEFDGTYWHSSLYKKRNYHIEKSKAAETAGIRLIHIWEYEWENPKMQNKIKLMLDIALGRVKNRVYARNCEIKQITNKEAVTLNEQVHLQGHRAAQVTYGLFYKGQLVQLMSFSHTRYNRNLEADTEWEIIRGCPGSNNIVVGGVSKLLKHFISDYHPSKIFSYCDFNKFDGRSYLAAGMQFVDYTGPDMKWLLQTGQVVNRKPRHHAELSKAAVAQLWGAGSKKYVWQANN